MVNKDFHPIDSKTTLKFSIQYAIFLLASAFLFFELIEEATNIVTLIEFLGILNIFLLPLSFFIVPIRWIMDGNIIEEREHISNGKVKLSPFKLVDYFIHLSPIVFLIYLRRVWNFEGIEGVFLFLIFIIFFIGLTSFITTFFYTKFSLKRHLRETNNFISKIGTKKEDNKHIKKILIAGLVVIYLFFVVVFVGYIFGEIMYEKNPETMEFTSYHEENSRMNFSFDHPNDLNRVSFVDSSWKIIPPTKISFKPKSDPMRGGVIIEPKSTPPWIWMALEPSSVVIPGLDNILSSHLLPSPYTIHILVWNHIYGNRTEEKILKNEIVAAENYYSCYENFRDNYSDITIKNGTKGYYYVYKWKWTKSSDGTCVFRFPETRTTYELTVTQSESGGKQYKYQFFSTKVKEINLYSSNGLEYSIICATSPTNFDKYCESFFNNNIRNLKMY